MTKFSETYHAVTTRLRINIEDGDCMIDYVSIHVVSRIDQNKNFLRICIRTVDRNS